jgi:hypothetical protein
MIVNYVTITLIQPICKQSSFLSDITTLSAQWKVELAPRPNTELMVGIKWQAIVL